MEAKLLSCMVQPPPQSVGHSGGWSLQLHLLQDFTSAGEWKAVELWRLKTGKNLNLCFVAQHKMMLKTLSSVRCHVGPLCVSCRAPGPGCCVHTSQGVLRNRGGCPAQNPRNVSPHFLSCFWSNRCNLFVGCLKAIWKRSVVRIQMTYFKSAWK